jgi:hypothetical protein
MSSNAKKPPETRRRSIRPSLADIPEVAMQSADREEFESQLGKLCAGYNLPVTTHRRDAYWSGLGKMSLAQFARCVDYAISEEGPEDLPTPKWVWRIHRSLRSRGAVIATLDQPPEDTRDHLLHYANRMFLRHLASRGGVGAELLAGRTVVRELVEWFSEPVLEGDEDATPAEFIRQFMLGLDRVSPITPDSRAAWEEMRSQPLARIPFPAYMGRPLEGRPRQELLSA